MPQSHPLLFSHGIKPLANMEALLNTPVTMPCLASQQKPRVAAPAANLSGLRRSSIKGSQVACRRPSLAKQRLVAPVRAAAAVVEETKVDEKTAMLAINAIRFLSIDGVNKANSGHPGLPMGCAPMGYVLYNEYMQHNPKHPKWFNRDRFVLSAGHGCMLQYSLMHLTGYESVSVSHSSHFIQQDVDGESGSEPLLVSRSWTTASSSDSGRARPLVTPRTSRPRESRSPLVRIFC